MEIPERLLKNVKLSCVDGWTALFYAVYNGDFPLIKDLIARGADIYQEDKYHRIAADIAKHEWIWEKSELHLEILNYLDSFKSGKLEDKVYRVEEKEVKLGQLDLFEEAA